MREGAPLGQHFLVSQWVARDLIGSLNITQSDTVLEIGPGRGALTKGLLATGAHVIAVEKDKLLVETLYLTFPKEIEYGKLIVVEQDIRDFDIARLPKGYILAANIPYYITGEIIRTFLETENQPTRMALLMQKEVAERIVARDGKESILSIAVKVYGMPSIVAKVPAGCFYPPPKVDSAILRIENISKDFFKDIQEKKFFEIVRIGFSMKRKMLKVNLRYFAGRGEIERMFAELGLDLTVRAEDVPLEKWKELAHLL